MSVSVEPSLRRSTDLKKLSPGRKSLDAELYGLGHTLRHLQPPGGKENGVFDAFRLFPIEAGIPQKKVKNYFISHVFDRGQISPPRPITPASETTHYHLFPGSPPKSTRSSHNHQKSTVFDPDPPRKPPAEYFKKNPITGESCAATDENKRLKARKVRNPITFEGVKERYIPSRCTQPPGGKCTLVLEYKE